MPYVIVYKMREGLNYYVQKANHGHRLVGIKDSALKFDNIMDATKAIPRLEDILGKKLEPLQI